jgi:integrase
MLWLIGAAQTDCSLLRAENVDWEKRVLSYKRKKTGEWCFLGIGDSLEKLLMELPKEGYLFPNIVKTRDKDRSAEFCRRCRLLKIEGISLHSYRYAWAEKAYKSGYAERFAQAALGHKSRIVHHAYARNAQVVCPALEDKESKVISITHVLTEKENDAATAM